MFASLTVVPLLFKLLPLSSLVGFWAIAQGLRLTFLLRQENYEKIVPVGFCRNFGDVGCIGIGTGS
jgi:hypothetical protein